MCKVNNKDNLVYLCIFSNIYKTFLKLLIIKLFKVCFLSFMIIILKVLPCIFGKRSSKIIIMSHNVLIIFTYGYLLKVYLYIPENYKVEAD